MVLYQCLVNTLTFPFHQKKAVVVGTGLPSCLGVLVKMSLNKSGEHINKPLSRRALHPGTQATSTIKATSVTTRNAPFGSVLTDST